MHRHSFKLFLTLAITGVSFAQRPGTPSPSIDLQADATLQELLTDFTVSSKKIAIANYGKTVASNYYVVSVSIINPNSEKVYLQSVSFRRQDNKTVMAAPSSQVAKIVEGQQDRSGWVDRGFGLANIGGAAAITFVKRPGARANYAQFLVAYSLFSALRDFVFERPEQIRLSTTVLRDSGVMSKNYVISGKSSDMIDVFINKDEVGDLLKKDKHVTVEQIKQYLGSALVTAFATDSDAQRLVGGRSR